MSENARQRSRKDRITINIEQFHEVQYWSKKFGCTTAQLRQAVAQVGSSARAVEREINSKHPYLDARPVQRPRFSVKRMTKFLAR